MKWYVYGLFFLGWLLGRGFFVSELIAMDRDSLPLFSQRPLLQSISYKGVQLRYATCPKAEAPLLFFIHGAPGSWRAYASYLRDTTLRKDFYMISVDRPGYGGSSSERVFASVAQQSELLSELLRPFAKKRPIILVGHSYGGPVALRIAMDHPDWVQGILLLAPAIDPSLEQRAKWRLWLRYPPLRWLTPRPLYVTNEEILALKADLEAMEPLYSQLRMPVYYIHGTHDILVPVANSRYAQQYMQHLPLTLRILKRVNHFVPWTHYQEVRKGIYHIHTSLQEYISPKMPTFGKP